MLPGSETLAGARDVCDGAGEGAGAVLTVWQAERLMPRMPIVTVLIMVTPGFITHSPIGQMIKPISPQLWQVGKRLNLAFPGNKRGTGADHHDAKPACGGQFFTKKCCAEDRNQYDAELVNRGDLCGLTNLECAEVT